MVEHFCIKFGDPSSWDIVQKNRQTDKRRWKPYPRPATEVGAGNYFVRYDTVD